MTDLPVSNRIIVEKPINQDEAMPKPIVTRNSLRLISFVAAYLNVLSLFLYLIVFGIFNHTFYHNPPAMPSIDFSLAVLKLRLKLSKLRWAVPRIA